MLDAQPALPVLALGVANVGSAAVRLTPQQFFEIYDAAFCLELCGALLRRLHQRLLRRRHTPPGQRKLAHAIGPSTYNRRRVVGKQPRHRWQVACVIPHRARKLADRCRAFGQTIKIAHSLMLPVLGPGVE